MHAAISSAHDESVLWNQRCKSGVEEGMTFRHSHASRLVPSDFSAVKAKKTLRSEADIMFRRAISVKTDKGPTICCACLGNSNLTIRERVVKFSSPSSLTKLTKPLESSSSHRHRIEHRLPPRFFPACLICKLQLRTLHDGRYKCQNVSSFGI